MMPLPPSQRRFYRLLAFTLAFCAPAISADASPLDKAACAKIALDLQNLKALDVDKLIANGPVWAADHLTAGDLALVRQYIDLDEQMKFRCMAPGSLVHLKRLEDDDDEGGGTKSTDGAAGVKERGEGASAKPKPKAAKASGKSKHPDEASSVDSR